MRSARRTVAEIDAYSRGVAEGRALEQSTATQFDPFMGSGSTIIAAMLEGRHAVGIELDPRYFAVAKGRVEALLPLLDKLRTA